MGGGKVSHSCSTASSSVTILFIAILFGFISHGWYSMLTGWKALMAGWMLDVERLRGKIVCSGWDHLCSTGLCYYLFYRIGVLRCWNTLFCWCEVLIADSGFDTGLVSPSRCCLWLTTNSLRFWGRLLIASLEGMLPSRNVSRYIFDPGLSMPMTIIKINVNSDRAVLIASLMRALLLGNVSELLIAKLTQL